jgi:hypothetical protein
MLVGLLELKVREFTDWVTLDMARQQGKDLVAVARETRRQNPRYGNPEAWDEKLPANAGFTREDVDLYPEFQSRVGLWQARTPAADIEALLMRHMSYNGMVRSLVKEGGI